MAGVDPRISELRRMVQQDPGSASEPLGVEWVVEAYGCDPRALGDVDVLRGLFDRLIEQLGLHPVAPAQWHKFPAPGGVTGLSMLAESHLACHTFPEHGTLCLNLFCCKPRPQWDFEADLSRRFGAHEVEVRRVPRDYAVTGATR